MLVVGRLLWHVLVALLTAGTPGVGAAGALAAHHPPAAARAAAAPTSTQPPRAAPTAPTTAPTTAPPTAPTTAPTSAPARVPAAVTPADATTPTAYPAASPALAADAPDPDVVLAGGTFYAFTTGTTWGNQIGIAASSSASPTSGWRTLGSAFARPRQAPASWEQVDTPTSPGVAYLGGRWVMFYDAFDVQNGWFCLSAATASSITGPYVDSSSGPLACQPELGGSIDPQPFVDPQTGAAYLLWKSNAGLCQGSATGSCAPGQQRPTSPSSVWSAPLTANGLGLAAAPRAIFTIDTAHYPWQTTTDDPAMVYTGGHYTLWFSGGDWLSDYYPTAYVTCAGPLGGCDQSEAGDPVLTGSGGTGGGLPFTDASGSWWLAYQSWRPSGCTSYTSGCTRQLFVTPVSLPPAVPGALLPPRTLRRS